MTEKDVLNKLIKEYPCLVREMYPFPEPHKGKHTIKAIILGADPTHIIKDVAIPLKKVFGLDLKNSPYWRSIRNNLDQVPGLSLDNVYVQNVCRNYFKAETTNNKKWIEIARKYWIPFLRFDLDRKFDPSVPVLMTTEFILHAALKEDVKKLKAENIYLDNIAIGAGQNLLGRELLGFYRHYKYSLKKWSGYSEFLQRKF